jgi:hypothetical protein
MEVVPPPGALGRETFAKVSHVRVLPRRGVSRVTERPQGNQETSPKVVYKNPPLLKPL